MAINQPPITGDQVMDAWLLEVTRELNSGVSRSSLTEANVRSISVVTNSNAVEDWALKSNAGEDIPDGKIPDDIARDTEVAVKSVDTTGALDVDIAGRLTLVNSGVVNLTAMNVLLEITQADVDANRVDFTFDAIPIINDTHFIFVGGMKLTEIRDYNIIKDVPNFIRLTTAVVQDMVGLRFELSNWSA